MTRKITRSVARIASGRLDCVELGNLDSKRDWGHARDYVEVHIKCRQNCVQYSKYIFCLKRAMWLMLQQDGPQDSVIATGETHSVREFVEKSFEHVGINIVWEGNGLNEVGKEENTAVVRVRVSAKYFRLADVVSVCILL